MHIKWAKLLLSIALLLPPAPLSASLKRFLRSRRNKRASISSLLGIWQNWVDLIRAGVGAYVITELAVEFDPGVKGASTVALVVEAVVLSLVLLFQTIRFGQGARLVAPVFYLCGFTLVLGGYAAGGFAVFVGWLFAVGGRNPAYQLPTMGVALGVGGYLLDFNPRLVVACALIFLPLFLSFMAQQQLAFVAREPTTVLP